jgi:transcriptional regulator with XRE-family HTH domain
MGIGLGTYITWELGRRRPSISRVPKLLKQLGCDPFDQPKDPARGIVAVRRRLGWSQRRMADFLEVDQASVARWISGASKPTFVGDQVDRFLAASAICGRPMPPQTLGWSVGQHLRERRLALRLSCREVAMQLNACSNSVLNWEKDRQLPEVQFWPAIIRFLGYEPWPKPTTLIDRIEVQRRRLGWTYKQAAEFIGIDIHTLLRWKNGGRVRLLRQERFDHLDRLARVVSPFG